MKEDIRDLKAWMPLADVPWLAIVAVLLLAAALGYVLWRRRRAKKTGIEPISPPAPVLSALDRLTSLESLRVNDSESVRRFHFELSEALRQGLEDRYRIPATDRTTEELTVLVGNQVAEASRALGVLKRSDEVKFTDYRPDEAECRRRAREAVELARLWKQAAPEAPP